MWYGGPLVVANSCTDSAVGILHFCVLSITNLLNVKQISKQSLGKVNLQLYSFLTWILLAAGFNLAISKCLLISCFYKIFLLLLHFINDFLYVT